MMPILQAYSIGGQIIEKAKWEVDTFHNLHADDIVHISIKSDDRNLLAWVNRNKSKELGSETIKDDKHYNVIMGFRIAKFIHMIENGDKFIDSLAQIVPISRNIELVLIHMLDPNKSDERFKEIIRSTKLD